MRKDWPGVGLAILLLAACSAPEQQQNVAPPQPAYNGPVVEIPGVEPRYEPVNPATRQDYSVNGKNYRIVTNPANYSEVGLASWYRDDAQGKRTATGESYDPESLSAAHPTLPLPAYVRVTNLANGRQIVVRVNDRGPYTPGRIIDLSRAAGDRLNISGNTRVRLDYIAVAPDGTLSGPGTIGTRVAKQSYALPPRPDLSSGGMVMMGGSSVAPLATSEDALPVDNSTLQSNDSMGAPVRSSGFLGAPQPLASGVLEGSEPVSEPAVASSTSAASSAAAPVSSAPASASATPAGYVVQVGALNDAGRAQQLKNTLSQRFGVPGKVDANGSVYRVQLGGYATRAEAATLQQRLASEAQISSFITSSR